MAAASIDNNIKLSIVADWRTGEYSQQQLSDKYEVSKGLVNKLCKGVEQDTSAIVNAGIKYRLGLAAHDDRNVTAINEAVTEHTKHIQFFNRAAITNVQEAMVHECNNQNDYRARAETILKGKETVLGKTPDTAIQINNNVQGNSELDKLRRLTPQQLEQAESLARIMESSNE